MVGHDEAMSSVPRTSPLDTVRFLATVLAPVVAKGPVVRRHAAAKFAENLDANTSAIAEMVRLHERYGPGPVTFTLPGRRFATVFEPQDVRRVLEGPPDVFTPASREKRGALRHFQPDGLLISDAEQRASRRPFNEAVLETGQSVHSLGSRMVEVVESEIGALLGHVAFTEHLDWPAFSRAWWRVVRRIVLGDAARADNQVTDDLLRLRRDANLSYLKPRRNAVYQRFIGRVQEYVDRAEEGSLAARVAAIPAAPGVEPAQQIPQWLFAFDAGAWATFRALAAVSGSPQLLAEVRSDAAASPELPFTRAVVLESLRLWPTTPLILRDTLVDTTWEERQIPAGTSMVIFAPYFHRDARRVVQADRMAPELWLGEQASEREVFLPFSAGEGRCPGREVLLLTAAHVLSGVASTRTFEEQSGKADDPNDLPGTLSPFHLTFTSTA